MSAIFLDCDLMRYPNSGLYHYCLNIGIEVNKLLKNDNNVSMKMYVPEAEKNSFDKGIHVVPERKWHKFWAPHLLGCKVWHTPFQSGRMVLNPQKHPGIRTVLTIHDLNPLHEGQPLDVQQRSLAHTQSLIDRNDVIVCISEFTRQDVIKNCNVGNKPLHVIHNGIHRVNNPANVPPPRYFSKPFLFGMGYVNRKKNYHTLLPLLAHNPDIELVVAGRLDEPDYISLINDEAAKMGVADRLHLTGPVSEDDKAWYLKNCAAFMHPSLAEGFGAPVVEAMLFGKPLFLSSLTSLPEIGGEAGFYFKSFDGEHMQQVFRDGMQQFEKLDMSTLVIKRGEWFSWRKSAQEYLKVYQSLL